MSHLFESLVSAVRQGDVVNVQQHLKAGVHVNQTTADGKSPLYCALQRGDVKILQLLIAHGCNINAVDSRNRPHYLAALYSKKFGCLELMLREKPYMDVETFYMIAMSSSRSETIKDLSYELVDLSYEYADWHHSVLHYAVKTGYLRGVRKLLARGMSPNQICNSGKTPLEYATKLEIVQELLENGADPSYDGVSEGYTPFSNLIEHGHRLLDKTYSEYELMKIIELYCRHTTEYRCVTVYWGDGQFDFFGLKGGNYLLRVLAILIGETLYLGKRDNYDLRVVDLINYYDKCLVEVNAMKSRVITDKVTVYDILTGDIDTLCDYVRNEKLMESFEDIIRKGEEFRLYNNYLAGRINDAKAKRALLNDASHSMARMLNSAVLVTRKIAEYLSDEDLKNCISVDADLS